MNSRDRTFAALRHEPADRIPIDFWASESVIKRIEESSGETYAEFLDRHDVDLRYIDGPAYTGPALEPGTDIWGVRRSTVKAGDGGKTETYSEVTQAPLGRAQSPSDINAYAHWPDPDMFDYSVIEGQCDGILDRQRVVVFMGDRLNRVAQLKPAMYLRGTEEIFVDLAARPQIARALFGRIKEFYLAYLERILRAAKGKIDIVLTGDDFGSQHGALLSPEMWRSLLKPGFAEYTRLIKTHRAFAMHHTCGSVVSIIPDMIACGLDVLQSIQPEADGMALADLKRAFGGQLCFQGGVSIQRTMPYGSPQDVRREVKQIAELVGSDGGYIFCTSHNIQADTPLDNITALLEAYREYGRA